MKTSKILVILGVALCVCGVSRAVAAQEKATPQETVNKGQDAASTQASGQTSGQGETAAQQAGKEATLTGCLGGASDGGVYTLTNGRYKKGVEVDTAAGIDLKPHVGHTVKLTGTWAKSGASVGEKEKGQEKAERHFQATKVAHVADTCTPTGTAKSKY